MNAVLKGFAYLAAIILLFGATYLVYTQAKPLLFPCSEPLTYSIGEYDARFGISEEQFALALEEAADVWNKAAGKTLIVAGEGGIVVDMRYGDEQKTAQLGQSIDAEQSAYNAQKAQVEILREEFERVRESYESSAAAYEKRVDAYQEQVAYWNAQGGAPPTEYEKLNAEQRALAREQERLNDRAKEINRLAEGINTAVRELNALARKLNSKVGTYNERAGEDFDQGSYRVGPDGVRITINEFESLGELTRVLTHEFGHALGIGHVENPESIMYSYNIGTSLELSEEDRAALRAACRFD